MSSRRKTASVRMDVLFQGRVQGVGFRYTVISIAGEYAVTGYVRNEWDGSVTLRAEGDADELKSFLAGIRSSRLGRYIDHDSVSWGEAGGQFAGFTIAH